jgi:uncharacterized Fe-S cluster-containing protein
MGYYISDEDLAKVRASVVEIDEVSMANMSHEQVIIGMYGGGGKKSKYR